ncbi:MAG: type II toxin-antitoxin system VapC family toxin [Stellaceae bacterium]
MLEYMLDTNICTYITKNYPVGFLNRFGQLSDHICISAITLAELQFEVEKSAHRQSNFAALSAFNAPIDVLPFGLEAATQYGQLGAELQRTGRLAGPLDMLIGAHARSEDFDHRRQQ